MMYLASNVKFRCTVLPPSCPSSLASQSLFLSPIHSLFHRVPFTLSLIQSGTYTHMYIHRQTRAYTHIRTHRERDEEEREKRSISVSLPSTYTFPGSWRIPHALFHTVRHTFIQTQTDTNVHKHTHIPRETKKRERNIAAERHSRALSLNLLPPVRSHPHLRFQVLQLTGRIAKSKPGEPALALRACLLSLCFQVAELLAHPQKLLLPQTALQAQLRALENARRDQLQGDKDGEECVRYCDSV